MKIGRELVWTFKDSLSCVSGRVQIELYFSKCVTQHCDAAGAAVCSWELCDSGNLPFGRITSGICCCLWDICKQGFFFVILPLQLFLYSTFQQFSKVSLIKRAVGATYLISFAICITFFTVRIQDLWLQISSSALLQGSHVHTAQVGEVRGFVFHKNSWPAVSFRIYVAD